MKKLLGTIIVLSLLATSCFGEDEQVVRNKTDRMGKLPATSQGLLDQEWQIYRSKHLDMEESEARKNFDIIQMMSAEKYDADTAAWAERRVLAESWLKNRIEDVYNPETVTDEMVAMAIDAYAFKSGHPALVTASHILLRNSDTTVPEERRRVLENIRNEMLNSGELSNETLFREAQRLKKAGFDVVVNDDMTFPRRPMEAFMGEQLPYQAVVEPFADAAFALSSENRLSHVVESEFGDHLILFIDRTEEKKADPIADRDFIVARIVMQGRIQATKQLLSELMQNSEIYVDEKRLQMMAGKKD